MGAECVLAGNNGDSWWGNVSTSVRATGGGRAPSPSGKGGRRAKRKGLCGVCRGASELGGLSEADGVCIMSWMVHDRVGSAQPIGHT